MTETTRPHEGAGDIDFRAEIERVHTLLAVWLGTAASPQILDTFGAAHDEGFSLVTTEGTVVYKRELLSGLHRARKSRPGLVIEISDVELLCSTGDTAVVRFVECQQSGTDRDYRRVTAVLRVDPEDGFRWLTLQETAVAADRIA